MPKVYWAILKDKGYDEDFPDVAVHLGAESARYGYNYLHLKRCEVATARSMLVGRFCELATNRDDALVLLDADHQHPANIVTHLVRNPPQAGVVLALCFMRGKPHNPAAYVLDNLGSLHPLATWPEATYGVDAVGAGALLIRRWVFDELAAAGVKQPYFRWCYTENVPLPTTGEDIYFSTTCTRHGIPVYVDTTMETPHIAKRLITATDWKAHLESEDAGDIMEIPTREERSFVKVAHDAGNIYSNLPPRLKETLDLIADGRTNKEIADALTVSVKTVEANKVRLMDKLGVQGARQLERMAIMAKARLVELNGQQTTPTPTSV